MTSYAFLLNFPFFILNIATTNQINIDETDEYIQNPSELQKILIFNKDVFYINEKKLFNQNITELSKKLFGSFTFFLKNYPNDFENTINLHNCLINSIDETIKCIMKHLKLYIAQNQQFIDANLLKFLSRCILECEEIIKNKSEDIFNVFLTQNLLKTMIHKDMFDTFENNILTMCGVIILKNYKEALLIPLGMTPDTFIN